MDSPCPLAPDSFLEIRVHHVEPSPGLTAACAGYELGVWRSKQFAEHLMNWLPEFALRYSEWSGLKAHNAASLLRQAARTVYTSAKYQRRGEPGELLLHCLVRQVFKSSPAISKYFYKDSNNDTVKGFDCVHVVSVKDELELWLGEAKFYGDISDATRAAGEEIRKYSNANYLRSEFAAITNKIDDSWGHAEKLKRLLHPHVSLDEVFARVCIPVLLTYDSDNINANTAVTPDFTTHFTAEVTEVWEKFCKTIPTCKFRIHLFLVPLRSKAGFLKCFDEELKRWQ